MEHMIAQACRQPLRPAQSGLTHEVTGPGGAALSDLPLAARARSSANVLSSSCGMAAFASASCLSAASWSRTWAWVGLWVHGVCAGGQDEAERQRSRVGVVVITDQGGLKLVSSAMVYGRQCLNALHEGRALAEAVARVPLGHVRRRLVTKEVEHRLLRQGLSWQRHVDVEEVRTQRRVSLSCDHRRGRVDCLLQHDEVGKGGGG